MINIFLAGFLLFQPTVVEENTTTLDSLLQLPNRTRSADDIGDQTIIKGILNEARRVGIEEGRNARIREIKQQLVSVADEYNEIFNFLPYLIKTETGSLVIPPIVQRYGKASAVSLNGTTLEERDVEYRVTQPAKLTLSPPTWREFLYLSPNEVPETDEAVLKLASDYLAAWREGVRDGWQVGRKLADKQFENSLRQLQIEFLGIITYHELVERGMISRFYVAEAESGINATESKLSVGGKLVQISRGMQFNSNTHEWRPVVVR